MTARPAIRAVATAPGRSRRHAAARLAAGVLVLAGGAWSAPVLSQGTAAATEPASVDDWFSRIKAAATTASFSGNYVVTGEGIASSARIVHYGQGRDSFERIESMDGAPRIVLRHNDTVHTQWPRERVTVVEQRTGLASFPSIAPPAGLRLDDHYRIDGVSAGRVAGREAHVLLVTARDDQRYSHRLWIDARTRLLLRADTLGSRHEVLESAAFTDLSVGVRPQTDSVVQAMRQRPADWRTVHAAIKPTSLEAEGWRLEPLVKGFRLVSCVRRPLDPVVPAGAAAVNDANGAGVAKGATTLQAVFSDGLAAVSVFIEEAVGTPATPEAAARTGATHTVMLQRDRHRVTVVGDVPASVARRFAEAVHRRPS